jgi:NADH-quinone oxidoreductase subunit J
MVLYVFVVAYIGGAEATGNPLGPNTRVITFVAVGAVLVQLCIAVLGTGLKAIETEGAPFRQATEDKGAFGTPEAIGDLLLTKFLLPFELASLLLTIAAVGAVVLARRRGGISGEETQETYSAMDVLRPAGTGTMREAVGTGIPDIDGVPPGSHPKGTTRPEIASGQGERREGGW